MVWNEAEILVWNMEDARIEWKISRMEWKNFFYISIPILILDFVHCTVFTEKYIQMSGGDK